MCTAMTFESENHYFGRTLDYDIDYGQELVITPKQYAFLFKEMEISNHYALIGMAKVIDNYPLYFDAINETGLGMAALNFPHNAKYYDVSEHRYNIAPFELIPWVLTQCKNIAQARSLLENTQLIAKAFNEQLPLSPLHWIIADRQGSIVLETTREGMKIFDNKLGVLTNNPPFEHQMQNLSQYMSLSADEPICGFEEYITPNYYSRGLGALGLPGDNSSRSRFVRAAFFKLNSVSGENEEDSVGQFFHIMDAVKQIRGSVRLGNRFEITQYISCANLEKGIYYFKTYENPQIRSVSLRDQKFCGSSLLSFALDQKFDIISLG